MKLIEKLEEIDILQEEVYNIFTKAESNFMLKIQTPKIWKIVDK